MKTIELVAESNFKRLDVFVAEKADLTRSHVQKLIDDGLVAVNTKTVFKPSCDVKQGQTVVVTLPDDVPLNVSAENIPLDIVYQDEFLAVINKPQGMTVHPATGNYTGTLVNALLFSVKDLSGINGVLRPGIVHRLDKNTSGLLVIAKEDKTHVELQRQIQHKTCHRIYLALLEGVLKQDEGVVNQPIGRSKTDRKKMAVSADGRTAETHYSVVTRYKNNTLVRFELKTGRTHQIRVHAKYIGHPVVGDNVYGYKTCRWKLSGQLLHACQLIFVHPVTNKEMHFCAPLPAYFEKVLKDLETEKM